ncbi:MAG: Gfo/Idh/MocA family oxidoreductase [Ginsengibacter sp.]
MTKRRDFIKQSLLGTAGIAIGGMGFTSKSYNSIIGANERINVAVAGIRSRGIVHIGAFCALKDRKNVQITTLCDTDEQFFDKKRIDLVTDAYGTAPKTAWDMRKVFEDKNIDAVSFATPSHWHALGSIWAAQAGKHVYVEKPCSHNIFEGRKMVEAARKYNVVMQVGFQNRSRKTMRDAVQLVLSGAIGNVYMARGLCLNRRNSFGIAEDSTPPKSLHYDEWLGPARWQNYNEKKVHYNWHWFWNTGLGDTGNQGPHQFDIARWGLNKNVHPVSVYSRGGIFGWSTKECAQETPDTQSTILTYDDGKIIEFETRGQSSNGEGHSNIRVGNIFYGTEGQVEINGEEASPWNAYHKDEKIPFAGTGVKGYNEKEGDEGSLNNIIPTGRSGPVDSAVLAHFGNFLDAIRSGSSKTLNSDILDGHFSCTLVELANTSFRLGRELKFIGSDEKFVNDPEANKMLTRDYRSPYVVPAVV